MQMAGQKLQQKLIRIRFSLFLAPISVLNEMQKDVRDLAEAPNRDSACLWRAGADFDDPGEPSGDRHADRELSLQVAADLDSLATTL
eukprot:153684-Rhodomonas_salina.1